EPAVARAGAGAGDRLLRGPRGAARARRALEPSLAGVAARVPPRPALGAGAVRRRSVVPRSMAADPPLLARRAAPSRVDAHAARLGPTSRLSGPAHRVGRRSCARA